MTISFLSLQPILGLTTPSPILFLKHYLFLEEPGVSDRLDG